MHKCKRLKGQTRQNGNRANLAIMDKYLQLESEALALLQQACDNLSVNMRFNCRLDSDYIADAYTKYKIDDLGIPDDTIIEFKRRLLPDTLYNIGQIRKRTHVKNFLLIILDETKEISAQDSFDILLWDLKTFNNKLSFIKKKNDIPHLDDMIIKKANADFYRGRNALILGAGVSKNAGLPLWEELLRDIFVNVRTPKIKKEFDMISKSCGYSAIIKAQYLSEVAGDIKRIHSIIKPMLNSYKRRINNELHLSLVELIKTKRVDEVLTFNYDDLLEDALDADQETTDMFYTVYDNNRELTDKMPIFHLHGYVPLNKERNSTFPTPIITEKEYHQLYKHSFHWSNITMLNALNTKTCFFIGLSMLDPNMRRLLDYYTDETGNGKYQVNTTHYLIMKKEPLPIKATRAQNEEHWNILKRMYDRWHIKVIWVNDFKDIPGVINQISKPISQTESESNLNS